MLTAEDLSYTIRGNRILSDVSLTVPRDGFFGIIGPNGAGKTTLMRLLAGIAAPTSGRVLLHGRPLRSYAPRQRARQIAFVGQNPGIGFGFTVYDVLSMGRYPYRRRLEPLHADDRRVIEAALAATGLTDLRSRRVSELSGGERQRVFLARALVQEPRLLFLDEPTANLDVRYQLEILGLVRRLQASAGLTVVMAIHDLTCAARYCDGLAALRSGRVVAVGPTHATLTEALVREVFGVENRIVGEKDGRSRVEVLGVAGDPWPGGAP